MKAYLNFELDIVLIDTTDIVTASPFTGVEDGFDNPNNSVAQDQNDVGAF